MKENEPDKNLEKLIGGIMKEATTESPSPDFTNRVMADVIEESKRNVFVYKPLISRTGWFIILTGILGSLIYLYLSGGAAAESASTLLPFKEIQVDQYFSGLHRFVFSTTTVYIVVLATLMIFIQITLLKGYLSKRLHK
jgi:hypothetical protein